MNLQKPWVKKALLLFLGMFFLLFSNGRWVSPLAAWLYPTFVLCFTRKTKALYGYFIASVGIAICSQISFWKFSSFNPYNPLFYLPALLGFMLGLPYLIDKLLCNKFKGILSTLVFPLAYTSVDFLYGSLSPLGSTGVLGYSQYGILPLVQIVSITGIWGLSFLITWFAPVVNWVLDNLSDIPAIKKVVTVYSLVILLVLLYGSIRLIVPTAQGTVRVSGIHVYDLRGAEGQELWKAAKKDWEKYRQLCRSIEDRLFEATIREARAGSRIIVWNEIAPPIAKEDEESFLRRAGEVSAQEKIYLVVSPLVDNKSPEAKDENKLLIFDPAGKIILTHYKYGGNFIEGTVKGDAIIRTVQTPYGRLSGVICWDQDFPNVMRQTGLQRVDILVAPTADWKEIDPIHTIVGYFRSIENGYSLVRQSINGLSIVTDSKGRILSSMDHYSSSEWVMTAQVPTKGAFTLYPIVGDLFGWLSLASLFIIICFSKLNPKFLIKSSKHMSH